MGVITWVPVAVNEKPLLRGKKILLEFSAAVAGNCVVLPSFGAGLTGLAVALRTIPFSTDADAAAWVEANRVEQ